MGKPRKYKPGQLITINRRVYRVKRESRTDYCLEHNCSDVCRVCLGPKVPEYCYLAYVETRTISNN